MYLPVAYLGRVSLLQGFLTGARSSLEYDVLECTKDVVRDLPGMAVGESTENPKIKCSPHVYPVATYFIMQRLGVYDQISDIYI